MNNEEIKAKILELAEPEYCVFSSSLVPGGKKMMGVRLPKLREMAKEISKEDYKTYLSNPSHDTFEEVIIWGYTIGYIKADIDEVLDYVREFIPQIDNWSVNDSFCSNLKIVKKNQAKVWDFLMEYCSCDEEFVLRFVSIMLMDYFLTEEYIDQTLKVLDSLKHEGYYLKMGVAWAVATAYAKFPIQTMKYLEKNSLDDFTYNKAIQKMLESYRVTAEDKIILRGMKRISSNKNKGSDF